MANYTCHCCGEPWNIDDDRTCEGCGQHTCYECIEWCFNPDDEPEDEPDGTYVCAVCLESEDNDEQKRPTT